MFSNKSTLFVLAALFSGCASVEKLKQPRTCSPVPGQMVCADQLYAYPEAGKFMCYRPDEIQPLLNKFTK